MTPEAAIRLARVCAAPRGAAMLMGIVNVTPDSFSDGGLFDAPGSALTQARAMEGQGADLLDLGGESTRPGAREVPPDEEAAREEEAFAQEVGFLYV